MEHMNGTPINGEYTYEYLPGYRQGKCIEKLSLVVDEFGNEMDSDKDLYYLKKIIEAITIKYERSKHDLF